MRADQTAGGSRRLMYVERKGGDIDGAAGRIRAAATLADRVQPKR